MAENKRIEYIPAKPSKREKRVGIYCRVSTNSTEQLKSLDRFISERVFSYVEVTKW
ncbi:MAG: resolvase domain protein [Firmicutes bacterium]|nr:resolvase domain protein [Bacillota bacterium]